MLPRIFREFNRMFESFKFTDLEALKGQGELTEETKTDGEFTTRMISFRSNDGKLQIVRKVTTNQQAEKYQKMSELRTKINKLLEEDNFEDAIILRDELKKLESELHKPTKQ
jgi:excinuclease UvrABC helicase subunit UvrB